jgi:ribonucleoside-diphosphate reductase alpha chain
MDFRDTGNGADNAADVLEPETVSETKAEKASLKADGIDEKSVGVSAADNAAPKKAELDSKAVNARRFKITTDVSRDVLLTEFGK